MLRKRVWERRPCDARTPYISIPRRNSWLGLIPQTFWRVGLCPDQARTEPSPPQDQARTEPSPPMDQSTKKPLPKKRLAASIHIKLLLIFPESHLMIQAG